MNDMRKRNLISSVILLFVCGGYGYLTANLATRDIENTTQPSFFPWVITVCLGLLSTMLLIQSIFSKINNRVNEKTKGSKNQILLASILSIFYLIIFLIEVHFKTFFKLKLATNLFSFSYFKFG